MKHKLRLAENLELPIDAVSQTFAFIGKRGSGKTYAAGKLVEEMLRAGAQVVIIEPVGNWFGLRLSSDGKHPGVKIPVFGGDHGDIPLHAEAGTLIADVIVEKQTSAVLDVSHLRKGERQRFVTDFAEQLFHRKKADRSAMHIVFEEAHVFIPQRVMPDQARMLGALEDIVKLGRNYGIGVSLLDQRPQAVNKDVLNQTECLLAFQLIGKHERKSIEEWAEDKGIGKAEASKLSTLPVGTAIVWSPTWLEFFDRVKIAKKTTFDASSTPIVGASRKKVTALVEIDLDEIRTSMAEVVKAADENDPRKLRKQIAVLQKERASVQKSVPALPAVDAKPVQSKLVQRIEKAIARAEKLQEKINALAVASSARGDQLHKMYALLAEALAEAKPARKVVTPVAPVAASNGSTARARFHPEASRKPDRVKTSDDVGKGPQAILEALATFHPKPLSRTQVGTMTGYKPSGSTMRAYLGRLRGAKLVDGWATLSLTDAGITQAGEPAAPRSTDELLNFWCNKVGAGPGAILRHLVDIYPKDADRDEIQKVTGYEANGSTLRAYLGRLRGCALIVKHGGGFRAGDALFPEMV